MLIIRLQRTGRENQPTYRLVVAEKARAVKGKFLEIVGHYLPARDPAVLEVQKERIQFWMKRGAGLSDTVARLLKKMDLPGTEKYIRRYAKRKPKGEEAAAPASAAPSATPTAEAAPAQAPESK